MGRWVLGAVVAVATAAPPAAAQALRDVASPGVTIQRAPAAPQPNPAGPPPPAAPRPGAPPIQGRPDGDLFRAGPHTYAPRYDRRVGHIPYYGLALPYGYIGDSYLPPPGSASPPAVPSPPALSPGYLRLNLHPQAAQVFIDGFFVGDAGELGGRYPLEPGPHRVEIRADGYLTVTFDLRIRPYETTTFTKTLEPAAADPPRSATVAQAAMAKTLYVIPRCYAGDKPPVSSELPAGCSLRGLRTIAPTRP